MKKIITLTESELTKLIRKVISEANEASTDLDGSDSLIYTTQEVHKLYSSEDPNKYVTVPKGTKFRIYNGNYIGTWYGEIRKDPACSTDFLVYVKKENKHVQVRYINKVLSDAIGKKFCESGSLKPQIIDNLKINRNEILHEKTNDNACMAKITQPYKNAMNWWNKKLSEPAFYDKLKRLNNYSDEETKTWINKYKNHLSTIKGPYCPNRMTWQNLFPEKKWKNTYALVNNENTIVFNVNKLEELILDSIEGVAVHEIQHCLYDLKPMTPNINWKKVFPYETWAGNSDDNLNDLFIDSKEKSTISKYNLNKEKIQWWKNKANEETDQSVADPKYACRVTELSSRVFKMKKLLNYSTSQKITVSDFKKFIEYKQPPYNDSNAYWLVLCWVINGMEDIETFLNNLDKYVVAKNLEKSPNNIKTDNVT